VALAAVAWSSAGVLQRELSVDLPTQLAGRALFAVLALLAYVAIAEQGAVVRAFRAIGRAGLAVAALMAVSSGAFIVALNYAPVANVLFMQALAPILAAALGTFLGEPVPARTWTAMTIALAGVGLMVGGPGGHPHVLGEGMALLMSISFAGTLVITRRRRDVSMAPATCLSQVAVLCAATPFAHPAGTRGPRRAAAGCARSRADRARAHLPDDRRAADPGRGGRADHAARDRPRAALGVARTVGAAEHSHARGGSDRARRRRASGPPRPVAGLDRPAASLRVEGRPTDLVR
jgi:EamA-like transporter family protein